MKAHRFSPGFENRLFSTLREQGTVHGPVTGEDGVTRLLPLERWRDLAAALPLLPAKKMVLAAKDLLWTLEGATCRGPSPPLATALVGLFPCDLHALDYLDRVFVEDSSYDKRRQALFLVGTGCHPGPECFCPPPLDPPSFDLFLEDGRVWCGSARGETLLKQCAAELSPPKELPLPEPAATRWPEVGSAELENLFQELATDPLWQEIGKRCLSCGACSAVCPTCYCYDVVDEALPGAPIGRYREWDNCFFRSHALVAGGHNFRPDCGDRLRFRFEHKMLGFGPLRGEPSCVGCGRCKKACPVDIEMTEVLQRLWERRPT